MKRELVSMAAGLVGIGAIPTFGQSPNDSVDGKSEGPAAVAKASVKLATPEQEADIKRLIEDFVVSDKEKKIRSDEDSRVEKAKAKAVDHPESYLEVDRTPPEVLKDLRGFQKTRDEAFERLTELKDLAFPLLATHLEDKRPSMKWWGHTYVKNVGGMCYRIIHDQLTEKPADYSEYGYQRTGRDGKDHVKPYWDGDPYDESGGLGKWLQKNQNLSYTEKRIKCLTWLLDEEKKIGVIDPHGYYVNILPLELGILELRAESGQDVTNELDRVRDLLERKPGNQVPKELMPDGPLPEVEKDHSLQETSAMLKTCPDGHANLKDIPILYGTFPLLTKTPAGWNDEDMALAKRRDAKEIIIGGEPDDARDPRFRSTCLTCGYYYDVSRVPGTNSSWVKMGHKLKDFTTPFFPAAVSLPFVDLADTQITVRVDKEGRVESETIGATIPAEQKNEMVAKIEKWIDANKFQRGLLHLEIPRYPRKYEERVENDHAGFFVEVRTDADRKKTRIAFLLERLIF